MRRAPAAGATISTRPRAEYLPNPAGERACGPTLPETGWAVEAAAAAGNRSAIPTATRKTPQPPPAFPAATHSPGDGNRFDYTRLAERRTHRPAKADTFN